MIWMRNGCLYDENIRTALELIDKNMILIKKQLAESKKQSKILDKYIKTIKEIK